MSRKVPKKDAITITLDDVEKSSLDVVRVEPRLLDGARIVELEIGNAINASRCEGSFVWLQPLEDSYDEEVASYVRVLKRAGAVAVKVLPKPRGGVVVSARRTPERVSEGLRETALAVAREARTDDPKSLLEFVEQCLARAGL